MYHLKNVKRMMKFNATMEVISKLKPGNNMSIILVAGNEYTYKIVEGLPIKVYIGLNIEICKVGEYFWTTSTYSSLYEKAIIPTRRLRSEPIDSPGRSMGHLMYCMPSGNIMIILM